MVKHMTQHSVKHSGYLTSTGTRLSFVPIAGNRPFGIASSHVDLCQYKVKQSVRCACVLCRNTSELAIQSVQAQAGNVRVLVATAVTCPAGFIAIGYTASAFLLGIDYLDVRLFFFPRSGASRSVPEDTQLARIEQDMNILLENNTLLRPGKVDLTFSQPETLSGEMPLAA